MSAFVHLEPAGVKEELQQRENGHVEVQVVTWVALRGVQELATDETHQEETVDGQCHHLSDRGGYCSRSGPRRTHI